MWLLFLGRVTVTDYRTRLWGGVYVGAAEGQRGETIGTERAAEGLAETETRPGKSQTAGGTHPQEGKTQEGDGEADLLLAFIDEKVLGLTLSYFFFCISLP